jgi:major membrane immunogen (membrane-anchored lipoprotein)
MITFLKKRRNSKTPKAYNSIKERFKKPIIRIIDYDKNDNNIVSNNKKNVNNNNDDADDDISFNDSKISLVADKFKSKKGDLKKNIMSNAVLVKELLIKAVDKHKVELCTQMASQLVEVYNNKQVEKNNKKQHVFSNIVESPNNSLDISNSDKS